MEIRPASDKFSASVLAAFCSLPAPAAGMSWLQWVEGLSDDCVGLLAGILSKTFGRIDIASPPRDARLRILMHLRRLEEVYRDWLQLPQEFLDFVLAVRCTELSLPSGHWYWSTEHVRLWGFRAKPCDRPPAEIRLIPLTGCESSETFFKQEVNSNIKLLCKNLLGGSNTERETLINHVETGCTYMHMDVDEVFGAFVAPLRKKRRINVPGGGRMDAGTMRHIKLLNDRIEVLSSADYRQERLRIGQEIHNLTVRSGSPSLGDSGNEGRTEWWREMD